MRIKGEAAPGSPLLIGDAVTLFLCGGLPNMCNKRQTTHLERRESDRDETTDVWITCFVELRDGTVVEGVVKDFSQNGAKAVMAATSLDVGDEAKIVIVMMGDQKLQCRCEARHVDRATNTLGLRFLSRPEPVEEIIQKRCDTCREQHPASSNFCPICGDKLRSM